MKGMMMARLWIVVVAVLGGIGLMKLFAGASGKSLAADKTKIQQGALVLDVRTPGEYQSGHYEKARNIPVQELGDRVSELGDKKRAIVVYCASGMRSARAVKILTAAGFTDVTNAGGLRDLQP